MRKGKERRRNFARSIRESARSPRRRPSDLSSSLTSSASGSASPPAPRQNLASTMPPPAKPSHKRQSLPASLGPQGTRSEAATGTKRKRDEAIMNANEVTPRRTKLSHRHSQTLGGSIMSAPPHRRLSHTPYKSRIDVSKVPEGSMLHNTLMKQARRLAPNVKSDTTHTDYFRLKALGIDPDTPVVPLTKKPVWKEAKLNGLATPIMLSPQHSSSIHTTTQTSAAQSAQNPAVLSNIPSAAADDDDEALFAQIRSVREALAQSEQWMNSERQSIERSMTPQRSISPTIIETTAQRRLREIRERGHTPSRSEIRLRAMGDKSLLPKGFWDGEGMGKNLVGKRKHRDEEITTPRPLSQPQSQRGFGLTAFAAIGGQGQMNGFGGRQDAEKKGAIFEDAIEL